MIRNYLKVASRNIVKRKLYSFINAFGLSIGIAFCVLIYLFIQDERSFDQFHENKANLYRMEVKYYETWNKQSTEPYSYFAWLQGGLKQALKDEASEVELATRFSEGEPAVFRANGKVFTEKLSFVDGDFFRMFSFKLLAGNESKLFANKSDLVVTPAVAKKYFGEEDPIGKTVTIDIDGEKSFTIVGLIEAPPVNSSLDFQILLPQENRQGYEKNILQWGNYGTPTFVQLAPNANLAGFKGNLAKIVKKYMEEDFKKTRKENNIPDSVTLAEYQFTPISDIHLRKKIGWHKVSDPQYSLILGGIAILILIIACINYVSLALTTSTARKKEVGVRKVVGAQKKQLVYQFGLESLILAMISMIFGLGLVALFLPAFNVFTRKDMSLGLDNAFPVIGVSFLITIVVGIFAGSYPAFFLSGFRPAEVLKGKFTSRLSAGFTRPLVVFQFFLSASLIISSVIMYRQMEYVTTKDLGYNQEQIVVIPTQTGWNAEADKTVARFRAKSGQEPVITSVSGTSSSFNDGYSRYGYKIKGENKSAYVYAIDPYYIATLGIQIVEGRTFDESRASDSTCIVVNEALVKDMKWTDPLNEYLNWNEDSVGLGSKVIGVVKDYHFLSLEKPIEPMFMSIDKKRIGYLTSMLVKIAPGDVPGSIEKIHKVWNEVSPDKPFDYRFLDQDVARQYESYQRWMSMMGLATGFAILISCLGLFGLAGINAVNRTKEIGIRKVMGAELSNIFVLLNRQYIFLSLIAFLLATPVSWYLMNKWLEDFKYKITVGWELFAISMLAGLAVALVTVSYHAIKASMANPAETLKYE